MKEPRAFPSPLAGEGAERHRREAGEGSFRTTTARGLRSRMTDAERKLWFALKDRRFQHLKFRRQVPVGPYVADFLCFDLRLIVEVDGGQHADSRRDAVRDRWFADNGFRTLRFWNGDVLKNPEGVLTTLANEIEKTPHPASRFRSPPPSPARGEGKNEPMRGAAPKGLAR